MTMNNCKKRKKKKSYKSHTFRNVIEKGQGKYTKRISECSPPRNNKIIIDRISK